MPSNSFLRFVIVGVINTLVDVPVFVALHAAGLSVLLANIISTSAALLVSLQLNHKFNFKGRTLTKRRLVIYIGVTLAGIWILQPLVISGLLALNQQLQFTSLLLGSRQSANLDSLLAKLASLGVSLIWNYLWYSRVVFVTVSPQDAKATG